MSFFLKHSVHVQSYWYGCIVCCLLLILKGMMELLFVNAGKGRGRQVIAVARTADLIFMMLDAVKGDVQRLAFCFFI